jgi:hypothetical protein
MGLRAAVLRPSCFGLLARLLGSPPPPLARSLGGARSIHRHRITAARGIVLISLRPLPPRLPDGSRAPGARRRTLGLACLLALLCASLAGSVVALGGNAVGHPPCYAAAARDPLHPCHNHHLDTTVIPTPEEALLTPGSPCSPLPGIINLCWFSAPSATASRTIALIGDSHTWHWRAGVAVAASSLGWHGLDSTRSSCPLTQGILLLPGAKGSGCVDWNRRVVEYLDERPEISVLFTSDHPGGVRAAPGQSALSAEVAGILAEWRALPANITHIVIIRDIPYVSESTIPCVEEVLHAHRDAGLACAIPRREALHPDANVLAAERLHSPRVQVIDLTHFFCDARLCYPVIGGALVYRDSNHLTNVYATSLGPYLLRHLRILMRSWH